LVDPTRPEDHYRYDPGLDAVGRRLLSCAADPTQSRERLSPAAFQTHRHYSQILGSFLATVKLQFTMPFGRCLYVNPPLKLRPSDLPLGSVCSEWSHPMNNHHRKLEPHEAASPTQSRRSRWTRFAGIIGLAVLLAAAMIVWIGLLGWAAISLFRWTAASI
jgi:hypothetical protein